MMDVIKILAVIVGEFWGKCQRVGGKKNWVGEGKFYSVQTIQLD
jgi:hypothetical protein